MTKSKKFVMKKKPSQPQRKIEDRVMYLTLGESMQDLLDRLEDKSLDPGEVVFKKEWYRDNIILEYHSLEDEEQFVARYEEWDKKIKEYNKWEEDHQEEIHHRLEEDKHKKELRLKAKLREISSREVANKKEADKQREKLNNQLGSL